MVDIRCGVARNNKTTSANTDNRLDHNAFLKENANRQIAISELGWGGAFKDFLGYLEMASVRGGSMTKDMQELNGIMRRRPSSHKCGHIGDRILKLLI